MFKDDIFLNKRYLITGASSGIGADAALKLNSLGAEVICIGRNLNSLKEYKIWLNILINFLYIEKDLSDFYDLDAWVLKRVEEYGYFNGAVLSAGIQYILPLRSKFFLNKALDIFNINYFANMQILKGLLDNKAKTQSAASFVWISSISSIKGEKGLISYASSKAAINAAVKSIALEFAPKYRINAISPGFVMTNMIKEWSSVYDENFLENIEKQYPLGIGSTDYISNLISFLLSDLSSWITGQNLIIDGGASI
ncbi:SDR family NAD(P)-dependent oxidoreductase [Campylobacter taeniopygiae]|uniref:NAD(P)-dependent oxidoreductase n=1 Tax=Campylobacter taeniopygiae TaxID=2510188 RepID=A0ABY2TJ05_9BACT|nr:SDR family oxidoreductase [Campylobacter taeniopygiae]TKX34095.1 NAD(P)-dependent oxidoreductase [Campylobacter taeniopygiae]